MQTRTDLFLDVRDASPDRQMPIYPVTRPLTKH